MDVQEAKTDTMRVPIKRKRKIFFIQLFVRVN